MPHLLEARTPAPDFTLNVTPDQKLSLSELRGRPVILAFYPADWSPVCGDQHRRSARKMEADMIGKALASTPAPAIARAEA